MKKAGKYTFFIWMLASMIGLFFTYLSSYSPSKIHSPSVGIPKYKSFFISKKDLDFNRTDGRVDIVEVDVDTDFSFHADKLILTPNYFLVLINATMLALFFAFYKKHLPFCYHLAHTSKSIYLTDRVLRI